MSYILSIIGVNSLRLGIILTKYFGLGPNTGLVSRTETPIYSDTKTKVTDLGIDHNISILCIRKMHIAHNSRSMYKFRHVTLSCLKDLGVLYQS